MSTFQEEGDVSVKSNMFLSGDEDVSEEYDLEDSEQDGGYIELSENEVVLKFSFSLMNKLRKASYEEGIGIDELAGELITEGLALRAMQDSQASAASHLMTRTGYVPPEANGNMMAQPMLSHHGGQNHNRGNRRTNNNGAPGNNRRGRGNRNNRPRPR